MGKGPQFINRELNLQPPRVGGPRRGFSNAADGEGQQMPPPSRMVNEPNQDERRQQLLAAMEARSMTPKIPMVEQPIQSHLKTVLQQVRPDWTGSELATVQEKLASVKIDTFQELKRALNEDDGVRGLNNKLKDAGKRPLKVQTLEALRDFESS